MKIAFLYINYKNAATINDHADSFAKFSQHEIVYFDLSKNKVNYNTFIGFDVLIIHYTISLFDNYNLPPHLKTLIRYLPLTKVIFIQDEYREVNCVIKNLNYLGIDILFTCIPVTEIEKVYPKEKLPNLTKINTLTGYVPEQLLNLRRPEYTERKLDVIYRARKISARYGRLALDKWQIVEKFTKDAQHFGLHCDLSYQESDRIYGAAWNEFIASSKAALGVESGASVFDFTGKIAPAVAAYEKQYPNASFEEIEEKFFPGLDGVIYVNQISPRCFEYAALGTLMILYEGNYSGILVPWRHYIPLKKDHSNIEEVINALKNPITWQNITETAYQEIACNPLYSYKHFVQQVEQIIEKHQSRNAIRASIEKNYRIHLEFTLRKTYWKIYAFSLGILYAFKVRLQRLVSH